MGNGRGGPTKRLRPAGIQAFATMWADLCRAVAAGLAKAFPAKPRWGIIAPVEQEAEPGSPTESLDRLWSVSDGSSPGPVSTAGERASAAFLHLLVEGWMTIATALEELGEAE